jgi:hypothetical protein
MISETSDDDEVGLKIAGIKSDLKATIDCKFQTLTFI